MRADFCDAVASPMDQLRLFPQVPPPSTRLGLAALGYEITMAWSVAGHNPERMLLPLRDVLFWSARLTDASLQEALALVASHLDTLGFTDLSAVKIKRDIGQFISTLHLLGVRSLRDVTDEHAGAFLRSAVRDRHARDDWHDPSTAVIGSRRTAVRTLFMTARHLGLADSDPTLDIKVAPKPGRSTRSLTDEEETLGRYASRMSFFDTRNPVIWALGQASAMPAESGRVVVGDVDLDHGRVWLKGTKDRRARYGYLTAWGHEQLVQRLAELDGDRSRRVAYDGRGGLDRPDAAIGMKIIEIYTIAGIRQPGITPSSLPAWRARQTFNDTGRIQDAADVLGVGSLDRAAKIIGWRWRDEPTTI